jgi:hypothetical protein
MALQQKNIAWKYLLLLTGSGAKFLYNEPALIYQVSVRKHV